MLVCAAVVTACGEPPTPVVPTVPMPAPDPAPIPTPPATPSGGFAATPAGDEELPPSQTTPGPIPLEFRHVWAIDAKDCTASPGLTRIAIAPGAIRFYEGRAVVVSADVPHERSAALEVSHSAEGETSQETHALAVSEDGRTLTYGRRGSSFTYTRCD